MSTEAPAGRPLPASDTAESTDAVAVILERMASFGDRPALFHRGRETSYAELVAAIGDWGRRLAEAGVGPGTVCAVAGDYSPQSSALLYALAVAKAISAPLTAASMRNATECLGIAGAQFLIRIDAEDRATIEALPPSPQNALVDRFRATGRPGLIVFSSGSSGKPKGIMQDFERVMRKFVPIRPGWRAVLFLMFDHFGGINTLLSTFAYGGVGVCVDSRAPDVVCRAIEESGATLLPTTPTFLNLMLVSGAHRRADLSSVKLITYGTEVMAQSTLERICRAFPNAELKQTYGLSELGVLRSKSETAGSTWVRIGGDGFEVKVKDNVLWVRSEANMVGYLNAPDPFDEDGWMCTGDEVEVRGEYMRILGRKSDLINVGGEKVYPAEVEAVLLEADNVVEAAVYGAKHPLMGQTVNARITLAEPEEPAVLNERLRRFCSERLARYKIPVRFVAVSPDEQHSDRFKKIRAGAAGAAD